MLQCKLCGTSNNENSSVCIECGASLEKRNKKGTDTENKEIFSNTNPKKNIEDTSDRLEVFSSGEKFEKAKKGQVLDKIYKQELALGEVPQIPAEPEPETFKPTVINRETTSDIVGIQKNGHGKNKKSDRSSTGKIPQRVIESSVPQNNDGSNRKKKHKNNKGNKNNSKASDNEAKGKQNAPENKQSAKPRVKQSLKQDSDVQQKKSKPADEELTPIITPSRKLGRPVREKIFDVHKSVSDEDLPTEVSEQTAGTKAADNAPKEKTPSEKQDSYSAKNSDAEVKKSNPKSRRSKNDKKKAQPSERAIQKSVSDSNDINAVKTERLSVSENKTSSRKKSRTYKSSANTKTANTEPLTESDKPKNSISGGRKPEDTVKQHEKNPTVIKSRNLTDSSENTAAKSVKSDNPAAVKYEKAAHAEKQVTKTAEKKTASVKSEKAVNTIKTSKTVKAASSKQKKFFSDKDIAENSIRAAFAYFGILFLIPFAKRKESKLCKAHSKQGIAVFIYSLILEILTLLVVLGLRALLVWELGLPYIFYTAVFALVLIAMMALILVPVYVGAKSAFNGKYKTVPIVGKYVKKKKGKNSSKKKIQ